MDILLRNKYKYQ